MLRGGRGGESQSDLIQSEPPASTHHHQPASPHHHQQQPASTHHHQPVNFNPNGGAAGQEVGIAVIGGAANYVRQRSGQVNGTASHVGGSISHVGGSISHAGRSISHAGGSMSHFGDDDDDDDDDDIRSLKVLCRFSCLVLGVALLALGTVSVGLEVLNLTLPTYPYYPLGTGVWAGAVWALSGSVGLLLSRRPRNRLANLFLILSTSSTLIALWGITDAVINHLKLSSTSGLVQLVGAGVVPAWFHPAMPISKGIISLASMLSSMWAMTLCYGAGLYDDCCCCHGNGASAGGENTLEPLYITSSASEMSGYTSGGGGTSLGGFRFSVSSTSPTMMLSQAQIYTPGSAATTELTDLSFLDVEMES